MTSPTTYSSSEPVETSHTKGKHRFYIRKYNLKALDDRHVLRYIHCTWHTNPPPYKHTQPRPILQHHHCSSSSGLLLQFCASLSSNRLRDRVLSRFRRAVEPDAGPCKQEEGSACPRDPSSRRGSAQSQCLRQNMRGMTGIVLLNSGWVDNEIPCMREHIDPPAKKRLKHTHPGIPSMLTILLKKKKKTHTYNELECCPLQHTQTTGCRW